MVGAAYIRLAMKMKSTLFIVGVFMCVTALAAKHDCQVLSNGIGDSYLLTANGLAFAKPHSMDLFPTNAPLADVPYAVRCRILFKDHKLGRLMTNDDKDAIRRTSGAYVLYPGEENREMRGFHEIVPGLGAFSIRPGHWQEDSIYLKHFLAEVKAHLMDRTSDREKLSYYQYDVHLEANKSMTMELLTR